MTEERKPPTAEEVFALVKEVTERMDRMGLCGMIQIDHVLAVGKITLGGKSERWLSAESNRMRNP